MCLQLGAAVGAECEIGLHLPVTEPAAQGIRQGGTAVGIRRRWRKGIGLGKKELAVLAIQERVLARPSPNGNEEELQNLVVLHQIGA